MGLGKLERSSEINRRTPVERYEEKVHAPIPSVRKIPLIDETVPVDRLIVFEGLFEGKEVSVLKDDGCNTNIVSREFARRYYDSFRVNKVDTIVTHSKRGSTEKATDIVMDAEIKIERHKYRSNWVVADCRYDVMLGMPWHRAVLPILKYGNSVLEVAGCNLPLRCEETGQVKVLA
eukprot:IDg16982t1